MKKGFFLISSFLAVFMLSSCLSSSNDSSNDGNTSAEVPTIGAQCSACGEYEYAQAYIYTGSSVSLAAKTTGGANTCSAIAAAIANDTFSGTVKLRAKGNAEVTSCKANSPTGCDLASPEFTLWNNGTGTTLTENKLPKGDYVVLVVFTDDSGYKTSPGTQDYVVCGEFNHDGKNHAEEDNYDEEGNFELGSGGSEDDAIEIPWAFGYTPSVGAECTEVNPKQQGSASLDCNTYKDSGYAYGGLFRNTTCAQLSAQIANGLITSEPETAGDSTTYCDSAASKNTVIANKCSIDPFFAPILRGSSWDDYQVLAGNYAALTVMREYVVESSNRKVTGEGSFPTPREGDLIQCRDITVDALEEKTSARKSSKIGPLDFLLDDADIMSPSWPEGAEIPDVNVACNFNGAAGCSEYISESYMIVGYAKDKTCSALKADVENGNLENLNFHAQSYGGMFCDSPVKTQGSYDCYGGMLLNKKSKDFSSLRQGPPSFSYWYDSNGSQVTDLPEGDYAVISVVDMYDDINDYDAPKPGDAIFCREVTLTAPTLPSPQGVSPYDLDDADGVSPDWQEFRPVDLLASCTDEGSANCTANSDGAYGNFLYVYNKTCAQVTSGSSDVNGLAYGFNSASCGSLIGQKIPTAGCDVEISKDYWCGADNEECFKLKKNAKNTPQGSMPQPIYLPNGKYAIAGYVDNISAKAMGEGGPGPEDILWCKNYSNMTDSVTSIELTNSNLFSLGSMLTNFHAR